MGGFGEGLGGFLSGFNNVYFPNARMNQEIALRAAQDKRAQDLIDWQKQKYEAAQAQDRQAAGLYAGMMGINPTMSVPRSADDIYKDAEAAGDFMGVPTDTTQENPQYAQLLAGGAKAAADLVKQTREGQLAALKARTDAWNEEQARRMADLKEKRIMAMIGSQNAANQRAWAMMYEKDRLASERDAQKAALKQGEGLPPEAAAKVGMVNQGFMTVDSLRGKIFDEKGNLNSAELAKSYMPGTEAAGMRQQMRASIEAALRIASGAAVPESEVTRYENMYMPNWYDDPKVARDKLDRLQNFYRDTLSRSKTGGQPLAIGGGTTATPGVRKFNPQTGRVE